MEDPLVHIWFGSIWPWTWDIFGGRDHDVEHTLGLGPKREVSAFRARHSVDIVLSWSWNTFIIYILICWVEHMVIGCPSHTECEPGCLWFGVAVPGRVTTWVRYMGHILSLREPVSHPEPCWSSFECIWEVVRVPYTFRFLNLGESVSLAKWVHLLATRLIGDFSWSVMARHF